MNPHDALKTFQKLAEFRRHKTTTIFFYLSKIVKIQRVKVNNGLIASGHIILTLSAE